MIVFYKGYSRQVTVPSIVMAMIFPFPAFVSEVIAEWEILCDQAMPLPSVRTAWRTPNSVGMNTSCSVVSIRVGMKLVS